MPYVEAEGGEDFDNLSHYGKTKFLSERELLKANNIKSKIILRPRAIYGAGDSVLLPRLLCLVKKNKIILPSNTTGQISLTHINNLLDAVELCLKFSENHSGIYNISDDKIYSLKEAIPALIRSVTDRPLKIFLVPKQLWNLLVRFNAIFHFIPQLTTFGSKQLTQTALLNVELAKKELGYSSSNSFYESLEGTGIWYRNK